MITKVSDGYLCKLLVYLPTPVTAFTVVIAITFMMELVMQNIVISELLLWEVSISDMYISLTVFCIPLMSLNIFVNYEKVS